MSRNTADKGFSPRPFLLIHQLHAAITNAIDTALSWDQLNSPSINYTLIRPIIDKLLLSHTDRGKASDLRVPKSSSAIADDDGNIALGVIIHALMANRLQFMSLEEADLSYAPLQLTRATFCELLAIKVLRKYPRPESDADLASELVREYCAFDGAPRDVWDAFGSDKDEVKESQDSALELIHGIYTGSFVYVSTSNRALISDTYISERSKRQRRPSSPINAPVSKETLSQVYVYNPYEAGWLDHGRLRVPKYRKWQEFLSQAILLVLFIATLSFKNLERIAGIEVIFIIYTAGFILDEYASSKEHGWTVYSANAWNVFDMSYIIVFLLYFTLRIVALASQSTPTSDLAFDILACAACILFPRLVFFLIKDNVVILALKAMVARFVRFMGLVIVAFSGICFCLWTLGRGTWTVRQITWLMLQIWFGSSYLGFSSSESFHPIFGPIILISYAALCNTLLITILISILSNEFADINANAQEEHLFQRVVKTVEGVKSDAIFCYFPPVNLLAWLILGPLSTVLTPRNLHRVNVLAIRVTSFPFLFVISAWERWKYRSQRQIRLGVEKIRIGSILGGPETLVPSVFEVTPPQIAESIQDNDEAQSPLSNIFTSRKDAGLRAELDGLKQSQLRIEELLAKVLVAPKDGT